MPDTDLPVMPGSDRASLLLQRLSRIRPHKAEGLKDDGDESDGKNDRECSDVDERGVVGADDVSFEPAADDCICNRNSHDSGNDDRNREIEGDLSDHLLPRTAEHITHGIVLLAGLRVITAESDDGHNGHQDADERESAQELEHVLLLLELSFNFFAQGI